MKRNKQELTYRQNGKKTLMLIELTYNKTKISSWNEKTCFIKNGDKRRKTDEMRDNPQKTEKMGGKNEI